MEDTSIDDDSVCLPSDLNDIWKLVFSIIKRKLRRRG